MFKASSLEGKPGANPVILWRASIVLSRLRANPIPLSNIMSVLGADDFAEVLEEKVIEKIHPLEQFPRMGGIVPEISDEAIYEVPYRSTSWIRTMKQPTF